MSGSVKQPLVLLPGLLCDARLWEPQREALEQHADLWIADLTRDADMPGMARRVLAEAPFERFALGALSMGGYAALEIMRQAPQRVTRLALLDTQARADTDEARERRLALIELADKGRFLGVTDRLLPVLLHTSRLGDARLTDLVKDMARSVGPDAFLRQQTAIMNRVDSRPALAAIACPTLVLCGEQDMLTPLDRHQELATGIPGARLVVVPACGHLATLERPQEVNRALLAWLNG
ncbi:MAG: alpha/beta fold hydrolase [Betaproteobacteria bacterium]|nr:alpha/beta fold hydrolase [Betaproteobacteria bacterium]